MFWTFFWGHPEMLCAFFWFLWLTLKFESFEQLFSKKGILSRYAIIILESQKNWPSQNLELGTWMPHSLAKHHNSYSFIFHQQPKSQKKKSDLFKPHGLGPFRYWIVLPSSVWSHLQSHQLLLQHGLLCKTLPPSSQRKGVVQKNVCLL